MSTPLIVPDLVVLDAAYGPTKQDVITELAQVIAAAGRAEASGLAADALAREAQAPTGIPGGIGIPHCRSAHVSVASLGFARLAAPVDFGAKDGPADLVFMIAAPDGADDMHLQLLAKLARGLMRQEFTAALRQAATPAEVAELVTAQVQPELLESVAPDAVASEPAPAAPTPAAAPAAGAGAAKRRIVAVTACPTGIAHTYMAAESLERAGAEAGVEVLVETQGSAKGERLAAEVIAAADAVILATDVGVKGKERFAGKPAVVSGVKRAINEPAVMIAEALAHADNPAGYRLPSGEGGPEAAEEHDAAIGFGTRLRQVLMTGVSYMIPFVAAGGLLIALAFLLGGYDVDPEVALRHSFFDLPPQGLNYYLGAVFMKIGGLSMGFLVAALAGYIAFALADRPGIAPGFTAGAVAVAVNAGFLGGIVGGLLAGLIAAWLSSFKPPRWLAGLMPVVIIPLFGSLLAGGLMLTVLGRPIAWLMTQLQSWLQDMSGSSAIVLGLILGLMMCFDLGGPVNKTAYTFAVAALEQGGQANLRIMAAVMAAGMVPPLAMALATLIRRKLFTVAERENGAAAWLLGASFISEGAIPFAAADPLRVIPSMMAGGAVTGAMCMAFDVQSRAPHGGIFVFFAINPVLWFVLSIVVGTVISALTVVGLKSLAAKRV
ncbi:PTS fructose transporter subunit IIABC [Buchananella hordeovulneris]|uniref:PTS lactose transporter subunit IIC n=1 Tax=Buchananella hordeovulneris TaxID=52770 RepID=A0A1Q5PU69_9ACTO|nr:fructose-specific PTS transporter subunit EIIC [Buchananella hordeovulneris]OKL51131.1 PTS lactose transporter subunit IIC [Buchananella hordeovulneris]